MRRGPHNKLRKEKKKGRGQKKKWGTANINMRFKRGAFNRFLRFRTRRTKKKSKQRKLPKVLNGKKNQVNHHPQEGKGVFGWFLANGRRQKKKQTFPPQVLGKRGGVRLKKRGPRKGPGMGPGKEKTHACGGSWDTPPCPPTR